MKQWRIRISKPARHDIAAIRDWYREQREGLEIDFGKVLEHTLITIGESAHRFPPYYGRFCRALMSKYPYKVFFRIAGEEVIIVRILHTSRDHRPLL